MVRVQIKGGVWNNTEDEILKAALSKYGFNQWARISSLLVRKTPKQCKARWYEWLDPSINKTEWSKEEDEKLLHLAKLMPTQWRTIAPLVGRTATQCLERYQRLLDEAEEQDAGAEGKAGPSRLGLTGVAGPEAGPSVDDIRRLRPGEIDPDPESKPARPDPIDMDEDEKEMLSEARARLANTQGKKAKRKARERALEEARRLAILQKRRELKAAGIVTKGPKPKKGQMDYNTDIPFEKQPARGFYDTTEEDAKAYVAPVGKTIGEMERKRKTDEDEAGKKKKREDKKKDDNFGEKAEQLRKMQEADQVTKRRKLMLPDAQVGEKELEEIVKLGQAGEAARELVAGGEATEGLLSNYDALERTKTARTPSQAPQEDAVMREARNLRNMTAAQTPLYGDANAALEEGLGNLGARPRSSVMQTPNPLLTPAHGSTTGRRGIEDTPISARGSMITATPRSEAGGADRVARTPYRDGLGVNEESAIDMTPFDERRARFSAKEALQAGLRSLPQPKNDFELVLDEDDEEQDGEGEEVDGEDEEVYLSISEDAADRDARMARYREEDRLRALARRSQVVQQNLPRPANVDASVLLKSLSLNKAPPADRLVLQEMVDLIKHDSIVHPIAGSKAVGGMKSDLPVLSDALLDSARQEVRNELASMVGFPGAKEEVVKRLIASQLEPSEDVEKGTLSASKDAEALDFHLGHSHSSLSWSAASSCWVAKSSLKPREIKEGQQALLSTARSRMQDLALQASKEEKKLSKLLGGYQSRSSTLSSSLRDLSAQYSEASVEKAAFERLVRDNETLALTERVSRLEEDVGKLERREMVNQGRYKELDDRRRELKATIEELEQERDMRVAERINDEALRAADAAVE